MNQHEQLSATMIQALQQIAKGEDENGEFSANGLRQIAKNTLALLPDDALLVDRLRSTPDASKLVEALEEIRRRSSYDLDWMSDGKDVDVASKALSDYRETNKTGG